MLTVAAVSVATVAVAAGIGWVCFCCCWRCLFACFNASATDASTRRSQTPVLAKKKEKNHFLCACVLTRCCGRVVHFRVETLLHFTTVWGAKRGGVPPTLQLSKGALVDNVAQSPRGLDSVFVFFLYCSCCCCCCRPVADFHYCFTMAS